MHTLGIITRPREEFPQAGGGITSRSAHPYHCTRCSWLLNLGIGISDDEWRYVYMLALQDLPLAVLAPH